MMFPGNLSLPCLPLTLPAGQFLTQAMYSETLPLLACVTFDIAYYHPGEFERYAIPCPQAVCLAAPKRQAEYLASRWLARTLFAREGVADFILTNNADRSPRWPAGFTGALSHSSGTAFLLADEQCRLVGNDVEQWISRTTADEIAGLLMNKQETDQLTASSLPWPMAVTVLFSIKESLYKALWPVVGKYIDFRQAEITHFDPTGGHASLRLTEALSPTLPEGRCFPARFVLTETEVFSWIVVV